MFKIKKWEHATSKGIGEVELDMTPYIGKTTDSPEITRIKFTKSDYPNTVLGIDLRISDGAEFSSPEVQEERPSPLNFKQLTADFESEIASLQHQISELRLTNGRLEEDLHSKNTLISQLKAVPSNTDLENQIRGLTHRLGEANQEIDILKT